VKYFQLLAERRLTEAERELERIKGEAEGSEWVRGYVKALEGLFLTQKSDDDKYLYLRRIDYSEKNIKNLYDEFTRHALSELHADYDRGYFKALADYMKALEKLKPWRSPQG
jgi:hypothetical protein